MQSVASATVDPRVQQPAGVRVGRAGGELRAGQQGGHRVPSRRAPSTSASVRCVQWSARGRAQLDGEPHARARAQLVGVHPRQQPGRHARPSGSPAPGRRRRRRARRTRRSSGRAARRPPASRPRDQRRRSRRAVGVLGRHHVRAEEGGLVGEPARRSPATAPRRSTVSPYPLLISMVVVPWASASPTSRATLARSCVVGRRPGWRRPWCGCRRRCTAARPSGRRTRRPGRRRRPGGRGCPRSRGSTAAAAASSTRSSAAGAAAAGPTHATSPSSTTSAASSSMPSGDRIARVERADAIDELADPGDGPPRHARAHPPRSAIAVHERGRHVAEDVPAVGDHAPSRRRPRR